MHRSRFEVLMEVLVVFYEFDNFNISTLMRKANIKTPTKTDIVDLLIAKGLVGLNNKSFLFLTDKGKLLVSSVVPKYKSLKSFYLDGFDW